MSGNNPPKAENPAKDLNLVVGAAVTPGQGGAITARKASGLTDQQLVVSPFKVPLKLALQNLAKAINLALQVDYIETELDKVYKAAKVHRGSVKILHQDYIGLGDGLFAKFGKTLRTIQLTLRGPDPASPEGKVEREKSPKGKALRGFLDLVGRKLNLIQEFEDMVPIYVEQMLDRLEATRMIVGWSREEWEIYTTVIGLDVILRPAKKPATDEESSETASVLAPPPPPPPANLPTESTLPAPPRQEPGTTKS